MATTSRDLATLAAYVENHVATKESVNELREEVKGLREELRQDRAENRAQYAEIIGYLKPD